MAVEGSLVTAINVGSVAIGHVIATQDGVAVEAGGTKW